MQRVSCQCSRCWRRLWCIAMKTLLLDFVKEFQLLLKFAGEAQQIYMETFYSNVSALFMGTWKGNQNNKHEQIQFQKRIERERIFFLIWKLKKQWCIGTNKQPKIQHQCTVHSVHYTMCISKSKHTVRCKATKHSSFILFR